MARVPGAAREELRGARAEPSGPRGLTGRRVDRAHLGPGVSLPRPARCRAPGSCARVGASFGGWIAAELATMASHRMASLTLIDPVGIKVDGWIYPFLFGMDVPEVVATVFHNPMAALALAPPDQSVETLALQYRQGAALARVAWNPYLYDPLLRRR